MSKTKYVVFCKPSVSRFAIDITMHGQRIQRVDELKYLGVVLDSSLMWKQHIDQVTKKVSLSCHALFLARQCFPLPILRQLYFALVHSNMIYCITSWGNTYPSYLEQLFRLQKRALRLITFSDNRTRSAELFRSLNILPLPDLVRERCILLTHSVITRNCPFKNSGFLRCARNNRSVSFDYFILFRPNNVYGTRLLSSFGTKYWNSLPVKLKNSTFFAKDLRIYIISTSVYL